LNALRLHLRTIELVCMYRDLVTLPVSLLYF